MDSYQTKVAFGACFLSLLHLGRERRNRFRIQGEVMMEMKIFVGRNSISWNHDGKEKNPTFN